MEHHVQHDGQKSSLSLQTANQYHTFVRGCHRYLCECPPDKSLCQTALFEPNSSGGELGREREKPGRLSKRRKAEQMLRRLAGLVPLHFQQ